MVTFVLCSTVLSCPCQVTACLLQQRRWTHSILPLARTRIRSWIRCQHLTSYCTPQERTAEPWILHDFGHDFYDEQLRLVVAAYIRPEANFESLDALVAR